MLLTMNSAELILKLLGKKRNDLVRTGYNNKNFPQRRTFTAWAENSKTNPVVVMPYVGNYCFKYE
jgi:hypothetical protein